jgi:hypothetical protein
MFPAYSTGTPWADADLDGMDDSWEIATFGSLVQTTHGDADGDGYYNIEEYVNSFFTSGTAGGNSMVPVYLLLSL